MAKEKESALEILGRLDPAEIDARIKEFQATRDKLDGEIAALRSLAKVIDWRTNGRPKRKTGGRKKTKAASEPTTDPGPATSDPSPGAVTGLAARIVAELRKLGPLTVAELAESLEKNPAYLANVIRCNEQLFERQENGTIALVRR